MQCHSTRERENNGKKGESERGDKKKKNKKLMANKYTIIGAKEEKNDLAKHKQALKTLLT